MATDVSARQTRPVIGTSFQTDTLDTGDIHDQLNHLWAELGGPPHAGQAMGEMVAEPHFGGGGLMRANTLNLIAVARNERDASLVTDTVAHLRDFLPSRTLILATRSGQDDAEHVYDVHLELKEQVTGDDAPAFRFETITVFSDLAEIGHLASLVSPLMAAELPDFLWWPGGDFTHNPLFADLAQIVDRVIVDSGQLGNDISGVTAVRDILDEDLEGHAVIGDFTWLRLAPWRQLIAQFFDPPDVQQSLGAIEDLTISYADTREDGSSGLASALLTVGWLGSRLGWDVLDKLERRKAGGYTAPLGGTDDGGRRHEISLRLLPDMSPYARFSLRKVEMIAGGEHSGTFRVERTDADDMITSSETSTVPFVSRMVYAKRPTSQEMLGTELQQFGHDRVFEDALRFATRLLP
ncbi:MAG TPA: glucose-6-phosphate dehydrogenase assembly protein OpcA [Thermomicrobiales bacterium]|nr:glucose-6-phosphate dehydrogenase assembly protein OpcA [Thermomicrobiales bacterium]